MKIYNFLQGNFLVTPE